MGIIVYISFRFQNDIDGRIRAAREKVERKLTVALEKIKELQGVIQRQQSLIGRPNSLICFIITCTVHCTVQNHWSK